MIPLMSHKVVQKNEMKYFTVRHVDLILHLFKKNLNTTYMQDTMIHTSILEILFALGPLHSQS